MDLTDPIVIATALIAGFGGFFIGRLLTTRVIGGCLGLVGGIVALVVLTRLLLGDRVGFLGELTANLGGLVAGQLLGVATFVAGFVLGIARRRRAA
jgi:hypothetical protein